MKVSVKNQDKTKRRLTIVGGSKDLASIRQHVLEIMRKDVSAPGFRKGKVPLNVVEKHAGEQAVQREVLEEAINHLYSDAINLEKLKPISRPNIEIKKYVPYNELEFTAELEVVPPIKLGNYKTIKVKKNNPKVTDQDIDAVLDNFRVRLAKKTEVKRVAKDGDELIIDFEGQDSKGNKLAGGIGQNYPLRLGSKTFIPGFEDNLIGVKAGGSKTFDVTFPKNYGVKSLAGKKAKFTVNVKTIQQMDLPKVDDEFAKQLGPFENLKALRDDVKNQLLSQKLKEADDKIKDEIVEKLVKTSEVILPETLVEDQINHLRDDFVKNLSMRGMTLKEYLNQEGLGEAEWQIKELKPKAERRVSVGLVLSRVADEENLSVTPEELDLRINLMKNQYQDEQTKAELDKSETRRDIANRLLTEKTLDKLQDFVIE